MWREQSIQTLSVFLREERTAVAEYLAVMDRVRQDSVRRTLADCYHSHQTRVMRLVERIRALGGHPDASTLPHAAIEGSRATTAHGAPFDILASLEANEDRGLKLYLEQVSRLDPTSRNLMDADVLPEQIRTHQSVSELRIVSPGALP